MATVTTQGWDLVAVAKQSLLNVLLEDAYKSDIFPHDVDISTMGMKFIGSFGVPTSDLSPAGSAGTNSMAAISVPIEGQVTIEGIKNTIPPNSTLNIVSNLEYVNVIIEGTKAVRLYLNLTSTMAVYTVNIQPSESWVAILNGLIQYYLQSVYKGGSYYLGTVNLEGVPDSVLPTGNIQFATQPNNSDTNSNIIALVANTSTGSQGRLSFVDNPALLPVNQNAALYISNRCILYNMLQPILVKQLNTSVNSFNCNGSISEPYVLSLNKSVKLSGKYDPVLKSMSNYINNNSQIQSDYGADGYPLSAFSSLFWIKVSGHIYLTPSLSDQKISFSVDTPKGSGSAHLSAGGWVIFGALVIASFGSLGAAVAAVVAIVVPILVTQLRFDVNMSQIAANIDKASTSFNWPAAKIAPLTNIALPGDLVLYVKPQV